MPRLGLLLRRHILHFGENTHGLTAIVYAFQIVVIQRGVIGEYRRKHALDRKRPAHSAIVVVTGLKRYQQINDVALNVQQMRCKIGVQCRKLPDTPTFKLLVVGGGADTERNVRAQLLRQRAAGICAGLCQKLLVLQGTALGLYVVQ